ncbi:MAG TPA: hypothetical protein VNE82_01465 [Candidatus Binataceae bacterium]|nr:hypothetical protein [Candidatus Binataceae bacterium]
MRLRGLGARAWPWTMTLVAAALWLTLPVSAPAQTGSAGGSGLPSTTIAPAEGEAPEESPPPVTTHHRVTPRPPATHHVPAKKAELAPVKWVAVEPAEAKLLLKQDSWIFAQPSNRSAHVEKGEKGKFVMVTGTTHYFLRVKLKSGQEGYVLAEAVALTTPADKLFMLTHNAPVLDAPNHWGKKVSEVHQGHAVHVVGIALSYMKIRMKSGLEGYIPASALE